MEVATLLRAVLLLVILELLFISLREVLLLLVSFVLLFIRFVVVEVVLLLFAIFHDGCNERRHQLIIIFVDFLLFFQRKEDFRVLCVDRLGELFELICFLDFGRIFVLFWILRAVLDNGFGDVQRVNSVSVVVNFEVDILLQKFSTMIFFVEVVVAKRVFAEDGVVVLLLFAVYELVRFQRHAVDLVGKSLVKLLLRHEIGNFADDSFVDMSFLHLDLDFTLLVLQTHFN